MIAYCLLIAAALPAAGESAAYRIDMEEVSLDGNWQDYDLPTGAYAYCPVYLEENGLLSLVVQTYYDSNHYIYLLDSDLETVDYDNRFGKGTASPESVEFDYFLTAGQYYVRVESWNDVSGLFRIKGEFTAAQATETEPNNTFEQAQQLVPNKDPVRGFLSSSSTVDFWADPLPAGTQDFADYYVFSVEQDLWKIEVALLEEMDTAFKATLYDSSHTALLTEYLQETKTLEQELPAGTYYLAVESNGRACGQYTAALWSEGYESAQSMPPAEAEEGQPSTGDEQIQDQAAEWLEEADSYLDRWGNSFLCSHNNSTYALIMAAGETPFTWMESIEFCEMLHGHLAYIESEDEQQFLADLVKQYDVNAWLGGYQTSGTWKWLNHEPIAESWWAYGEPNGSGDSLQLFSNGLWDDTFNKNETVTAFICEWEN